MINATDHRYNWQAIVALSVVATVMGLIIAMVVNGTNERITNQREAARVARLAELLPAGSYDNILHQDQLIIDAPAQFQINLPVTAYRARLNNQVVSVIFSLTTSDGYNGNIALLVAIHANGRLQKVRVARHQETPGLGDLIEVKKSDWIKQFSELQTNSFDHQDWQLRKHSGQFDQLTGATITATAVLGAIERTVVYFDEHREWLLTVPSNQSSRHE